jgi:hypothetical protein
MASAFVPRAVVFVAGLKPLWRAANQGRPAVEAERSSTLFPGLEKSR